MALLADQHDAGGAAAEEGAKGGEGAPLLKGVQLLALEAHEEGALWDLRPCFVVLFDPDIAVIRQLEVRQLAPPPPRPLLPRAPLQRRSLRLDLAVPPDQPLAGRLCSMSGFRKPLLASALVCPDEVRASAPCMTS